MDLWLPGDRPKPFICRLCQERFSDRSRWTRHLVLCAKRHEPEIREMSPRNRLGAIYDRDNWDSEFEKWVDDNKTLIREGRKILYKRGESWE